MAREILELILNKEFDDMKESFKSKNSEFNIEIINKEGDVIIPLNKKINFDNIKKNILDTKEANTNFEDDYMNYKDFMQFYVNDKVKIARNINAVQMVKLLSKELFNNELFYGMIVTDEKNFYLNVTHPLILKRLKDTGFKGLPEKMTVMIFEINLSKKKDEINANVFAGAMQRHIIFTKLYSLLTENAKGVIKIVDEYSKTSELLPELEAYIRIEKSIDLNTMLIPTQIATKGEMIPWFGYALIEASGKGFSSLDFATGNIDANSGWNASAPKICTGDYNNQTLDGWYTMSKINLSSMYHSYIINSNTWFDAHQAAIEIDKLILQNKEKEIF